MAKTIIQTIGPLYGDVVNGTVFGRPNGSVFVPPTNTITISLIEEFRYIRNQNETVLSVCNSSGGISYSVENNRIKLIAQSQDSQNYMRVEVATDSDFTDVIASSNITAGIFNTSWRTLTTEDAVIENGTTYYLRACLYASSGVAVSVSDTIELEGWAE